MEYVSGGNKVSQSGTASGRFWWVINAAIVLIFPFVLNSCASTVRASPEPTPTLIPPDNGDILVLVADQQTGSSLNGVVVRITNSPLSDGVDHRELQLSSCDEGQFLVVSAPGYETSFTRCNGSNLYRFFLNKLSGVDNTNYMWSSAYGDCGTCHARQLSEGYNEVDEWGKTAHAKVLVDPYFETMYRGTNIYGQITNPTENYGPGFKLDHPDQAGNCAYCHAPSTILASRVPTDLSSYYPRPAGANGEGITCDVCHKISGVVLDDNNYPLIDQPGMLSFKFMRLSNSFVFGPFSNILLPVNDSKKHVSSSCAPILSTSEFCAACHYGKFNDVLIYNSYGEWRESQYGKSDKDSTYKTCQDCHMSHMDVKNVSTSLSTRSACSETTDQYQNFDHNLMDVGPDASGKEIPRMIQNAASLKVKLKYEPDKDSSLRVRVEVENIKAGHKFPTDSPLRQLILVINATDQFESPLVQVKGDKLPAWAGVSNPSMSQNGMEGYAGFPGAIYADLLMEEGTNLSPTAAYWNKTKYVFVTKDGKNSDTRLLPGDPQVSNYSFVIPDLGDIHITVKLIYRFAFFDLMDQKDWARPDIVVAAADCHVSPEQAKSFDCPEVQP